jgi:protein-L-isoaspartate(D-aspartate) O-methyltransferase
VTETHTDLAEQILAEAYWGDDTLADPAWREAFNAVPRFAFAPCTWYEWDGYGWTTRRRTDDEDAWEQAVHAVDKPFITQIDTDGAATCSLSAPMLVAAMLGTLDLGDGMRVFESGAGAGWTASLMAKRVGPDGLVVAAEYDPHLAAQATLNAAAVGAHPVIVVGDGEAGAPDYAPFDRASATHSVRRIPPEWIRQTRPGGLVCAPVKVAEHLDLFVRLAVAGDGSAEGRVVFPVDFMPSRAGTPAAAVEQADDPKRPSTTDFDLPAVVAAKELWPIQVAVPGLSVAGPLVEDGDDCMWLTAPDGSWAVAYVPQGTPWKGAVVEQHGPRDLWTLAEAALARWDAAGAPGVDGYGLTVEPDGTHRLWMGEPGNTVAVLP